MSFKKLLYENLPKMKYEDYEKYLEEEKNGFITIKTHPEDENLVILNYTDLTVYERRWTDETMKARGLILDLTDIKNNDIYILSNPFEKFFNYGEDKESDKELVNQEIESVMEKMDGSLGISYFFKDEIRFATRGSFASEQALKATEIWKKNHSHLHNMKVDAEVPVTYLVEIIYPQNRIVVDYGDKEELVLLGVKTNRAMFNDKEDFDYESICFEARDLDMRVAPQYNQYTFEDLLEKQGMISANEEGWVVRFKNGKRLKIKGTEYMQVHRIYYGLSTKAKYKAWYEGKLDTYIMSLPEEFRDELENFRDYIDSIFESTKMLLLMQYESALKNAESDSQRDYAKYVKLNFSLIYHNFLFNMKRHGKLPEEKIKYSIYKNYSAYEEGFEDWKKLHF